MKRTMLALVSSGLTLLAAAPAWAQYPTAGEAAPCEGTTVTPGEDFCVSGSGWQPDSEVTIAFGRQVIGRAVVGAQGSFRTFVPIPATAGPGGHVITVSGINIRGVPDTDTFTVTVAGLAAPIAFTGTNVTLGAVLLTILTVVGVAALTASRRRKAAAER